MTASTQQYLKTIYKMGGDRKRIGTNNLAKKMDLKPPSITEKMKKLQKDGYIDMMPYKGIILTEKGVEAASELIKIQRLWEVFLKEYLNMDIEDISEEACNLEHATTPLLTEKLEKFLKFPKECPHGKKIVYKRDWLN